MRAGAAAPVIRPKGAALHVDRAVPMAGEDGVAIRTLHWRPEGCVRGRALILTGRAEFAEKYDETACELTARGFVVACPEWRGQGLSDAGPLGDALQRQRDDLDALRPDLFDGEDPDLILAHSMGGAHALALLSEDPSWARALAMTAPMLGVHLPTLEVAVKFYLSVRGRLGGVHQFVSRELADGFEGNPLTHDRARWELQRRFIAEEPRFGAVDVSVEWLTGALRLIDRLGKRDRLASIETPILLASAKTDPIVLSRRHERAVRHLPNARILHFENCGHEILQETDAIRAVFWRAFDDFLDGVGL